jgi:hypothetical protein
METYFIVPMSFGMTTIVQHREASRQGYPLGKHSPNELCFVTKKTTRIFLLSVN